MSLICSIWTLFSIDLEFFFAVAYSRKIQADYPSLVHSPSCFLDLLHLLGKASRIDKQKKCWKDKKTEDIKFAKDITSASISLPFGKDKSDQTYHGSFNLYSTQKSGFHRSNLNYLNVDKSDQF